MKKTAIFLILLLSIPGISGCGGSQNPASAVTAEEVMTSAENGGDTDEKNWSRQEILSMFENVKEDCWSVAGCVPISDDAYDRVGAVLFYDSETETSNTAFFDEEGNYQMCGVSAKIYSEPDFTYHGDGVVTFYLEAEEGSAYRCKIAFSADGSEVFFVREDGGPKRR